MICGGGGGLLCEMTLSFHGTALHLWIHKSKCVMSVSRTPTARAALSVGRRSRARSRWLSIRLIRVEQRGLESGIRQVWMKMMMPLRYYTLTVASSFRYDAIYGL